MRKSELLGRVRQSHDRIVKSFDGLSEEDATRVGLNANWSVRDAISHIVAWETECARVVAELLAGKANLPNINKEFVENFNARAVEERRLRTMREVADEFNAVRGEVERVVETMPDEVAESSIAYKLIDGIVINHNTHHAAQVEEWKNKMTDAA